MLKKAATDCDAIFHLAAMVSVPESVDKPVETAMVNDIGSLLVLETARRNKVKRVVLSSSCAVYGEEPKLPKTEDTKLSPMSPYAIQKLVMEYYALLYYNLYSLQTVCLRYFNVYGPRQNASSYYSGVISIFITNAVNKVSPVIYGNGKQYRDFILVNDVVTANLLAATKSGVGGMIFNVGTGNFIRIGDLWKMICLKSDVDIDALYEQKRVGDIFGSVANIERIKSKLGFKPRYSAKQGLEMTVEWYKAAKNHDQPF